jgi:hypothetical protein
MDERKLKMSLANLQRLAKGNLGVDVRSHADDVNR